MANASDAIQSSGLPLDQYTQTTPPGWKPFLTHYPFRRFVERLRLWYRLTNLEIAQIGTAVAGRLQGRPFNIAMSLTVVAHTGVRLVGDEALSYEGQDAGVDPQTGQPTPAHENGLQQLLRLLTRWYGADQDQNTTEVIDQFIDLRRGRLSLLDYLNEHQFTYDEAALIGGLQFNEVGRTHYLLKYSGMTQEKVDNVLLQVGNNLQRYDEVFSTLTKIAKTQLTSQLPGPTGYYGEDYDEDWYGEDDWYDAGYYGDDYDYEEEWYDGEQEYYDAEDWWYDEEWQEDGDWQEEEHYGDDGDAGEDDSMADGYYGKGKGKGKGK